VPRLRRIAIYAGAAVVLWLAALVVLGNAIATRTRDQISARIADSLQARATIDDGDLALVRGTIDLDNLAVRRDDAIGHLAIGVASIHCELRPLGVALVDRHCRLEVSTAALFKLRRPKRPPLHAGRVVIDDARFALLASAVAPGVGHLAVAIHHADAGETTFKTPLSWIFALHTLHATIDLPSDLALRLDYEAGELRIAGGMFGATPIALPVTLPVADAADDPRAEMARLVEFGKDVAERLIARKAEAWLRSKLASP
jgi:hypothetical protein